jgi:hypothetical protein
MTKTQARDARKNKKSPMMRIPAELKNRIERLRGEFQESYEAGRHEPKTDVDSERLPAWYVIQLALDELEGHRARSRKSRNNSKTIAKD